MSGQDDRKLPAGDQSDEILTPKNANSTGEDNTPSRVLSSHSLLGENIVLSSRPSSAQKPIFSSTEFSPSSIDASETTTPPTTSNFPISLSPPPLNIEQPFLEDEPESDVLIQEIQQFSKQAAIGRRRPPRVPHVALPPHPSHTNQHHGRVQSSTDYSFMSALTEESSSESVTGGEGRSMMRRKLSWESINGPSGGGGSPSGNVTASSNNHSTITLADILQPILLDENNPSVAAPPPKSIMTTHTTKNEPETMNPPPPLHRTIGSNTETSPQDATDPPSGLPTSIDTKTKMEDKVDELTPEEKQREILELPKRYNLMELQDAIGENDVESAVLQSMENAINTSYSASSRSLMPSISDDRVHDFEDDAEEKSPKNPEQEEQQQQQQKQEESNGSELADLTQQLRQTQRKGVRNLIPTAKNTGEKNTGEKMAETASVIFAANSSTMKASFLETARSSDVETGVENSEHLNQEDQEDISRTRKYTKKARRFWRRTRRTVKDDTEYFLEFLEPKKAGIILTWTRRVRVFMLPSLGMAVFLYYVAGNPPGEDYGRNDTPNPTANDDIIQNDDDSAAGDDYYVYASGSWWVLFLGVRQVVTLFLAQMSELLIIDFLTLRTRFVTKACGPYISLLIAQSKGWPFQLAMWGLIDVCMLAGNGRFARHWLFWQDFVNLMNDNNPAGNVTNTSFYLRLLYLSMGIGAVVTVKRSLFGRLVGKSLVGT
jgi:hypothetical protein